MREFLIALLGISAFTVAFFAIIALRPTTPSSAQPVVATRTTPPQPTSKSPNQSQQPVQTEGTSSNPLTQAVQDNPQPIQPTPQPVENQPIPPTTQATETPAPPTNKHIVVTLNDQNLRYFEGEKLVGEFKISSGLRGTPTPPGEYTVLAKKPLVDYNGPNYSFPKTKWNLMFKAHTPLNYYIHGAYWHNNFGHPMSHGCVNVAYANMEGLYNWADVGTPISIQ